MSGEAGGFGPGCVGRLGAGSSGSWKSGVGGGRLRLSAGLEREVGRGWGLLGELQSPGRGWGGVGAGGRKGRVERG